MIDITPSFRLALRGLSPAIVAYRLKNPNSRACRDFNLVRSTGSVRRYSCTFCREIIDTESAKYRPTRHAERNIENHACHAKRRFTSMAKRLFTLKENHV